MPKMKVKRRFAGAQVSEAEALWFDTSRFTGFVDGFGHLERADGEWPSNGARIVWDSRPGGRGRVVERTTSYRPGAEHVSTIEDEQLEGEQTTTFEQTPKGAQMTIEMRYRLKERGIMGVLSDVLFIRGALKASHRRTLARFERELSAERELTRQ